MHKPQYATIHERTKNFEEVCRQNGIKLTHQRLEIYRELARDPNHPSAEDLFKRMRDKMPTISLDTIYRTLTTFERVGLISKVQILDDRGRFDANIMPHHHLVCTRCKSVSDFAWPGFLNMEMPQETKEWGIVSAKRVELSGICNHCIGDEGIDGE